MGHLQIRLTRLLGIALVLIGLTLVIVYWPQSASTPRDVMPTPEIAAPPAGPTVGPSPGSRPFDTTIVLAAASTLTPTATATSMPTSDPTSIATSTLAPSATLPATRSPTSSSPATILTASVTPPVWRGHARFGISVPGGSVTWFAVDQIGTGWYFNWHVNAHPVHPAGMEYVQMIRTPHGILEPDAPTIASVARAVPGSLWLVGNEPDRTIWQDDATPVQYAQAYHQAYETLKQADQTASVAIAGVIQPTPLRLKYLDAVLAAYQQLYGVPMPVDVWNVHNFILNEQRGSWGAEIPTGLPDTQGVLREVDDNDNLEIFKSQIWAFRRWMRDRGQQNKPLIVSEYGILMPPDYGFGPERVSHFLVETFAFFLSTGDSSLGYPPDGNRLVQRWCWYSLSDTMFPAGNLFDPQTFQMTPAGRAWRDYVLRQ